MKKNISFVLAVMMLIANFAVLSFAADTNTTFKDVTDTTKYSKSILTMVKLGVVNGYAEDNTFRPEAGIKRSEFTAVITRAMGIANGATGVSPFTDVAQDHWALKNIIAASSREIVNGMGDGTFHPEDNVTYEQALKMVVCALNYKNVAEAAGGWNAGAYFNQAVTLGLTKDVGPEAQRNSPAPRGVVAQIMYNALNAKVADEKTSEVTDDTFLNRFLKMEMAEGTIVGVENDVTADCEVGLGLYQMALVSKNKTIVLDFKDYGEKTSILPHLGQDVLVFYSLASSGDANKLVILDTETTENETIEISYEDIIDYSNGKIEYYNQSGRKTDVEFETDDITLFYNKKAVEENVESELSARLDPVNTDTFLYGTVTLTDSGFDRTIDMVEIMDYDYLVSARTVSSSNYTVTNKMKFVGAKNILESVVLNPEKKSPALIVEDSNGVSMQPTAIKVNNIVMVAKSKNEDAITVKVSSKTVDGEMRALSKSEGTVYIDAQKYGITKDCIAYLEAEEGGEIENGKKGKFYLDAFGNIAYATLNVNSDTMVTGYLVKANYDYENDNVVLRVIVPGKGYESYTLDEKVVVDNDPNKSYADIETYLQNKAKKFQSEEYEIAKDDDGNLKTTNANQLVKLEVKNNVVTEIITVGEEFGNTDNSTGLLKLTEKPLEYKRSGTTFTSKDSSKKRFFTNNNTVFIYVPEDRSETSAYKKYSASSLATTTYYRLEPVNVTKSNMAEIVVIYGTKEKAAVTDITPLSILASAPEDYLDASEDILTKFTLFTNSNVIKTVDIDEDEDVTGMQPGDIFRYAATMDKMAGDIKVCIKYADIKEELAGGAYDWTDDKFVFGSQQKIWELQIPYTAATMYNVIETDEETSAIYVTRDGFVDGKLPEENADWVNLGSAKIIKISDNGQEVLADDEGTEFGILDLAEAKIVGDKCSKIAVIRQGSEKASLIVIYE